MKTLWNAVSFLAVVHLLALAMSVGWLWHSKRLSRDRIDAARAVFAVPVPEAESLQQAQDAEAAATLAREQTQWARENPPPPSAELIGHSSTGHTQLEQVTRRMNDEQQLLLDELKRQADAIRAERAAFERERAAWAAATEAERVRKTDEQFLRTVALLEGLPSKQVKTQLVSMIESDQMNEAVAYLNAMTPRGAQKVMGQFKSPEEAGLATELLDRLRRYGTGALLPQDPSNADEPPQPQ